MGVEGTEAFPSVLSGGCDLCFLYFSVLSLLHVGWL